MKQIKKFCTLAIFFVALFLLLPISVFGFDGNDDVKITKGNGEVTLEVLETGDKYEIFKDEELVYEGKENVFKETMDYDIQKYRIGVYSGKELIKVISMKVTNDEETKSINVEKKSKEEFIKETIQNTKLEAVIGDSYVSLKWPELPDEDKKYILYRDGEKIAETKELSFIDETVEPGTIYKYTVRVDNVLSDNAKREIMKMSNDGSIDLNDIEQTYSGTISTLVITPDNTKESLEKDQIMSPLVENDNNSNEALANVPPFFDMVYRTFIPFKSVKNPVNWFSKHKYLKGDDRTQYLPYTDRYRTESVVYGQFDFPPALAHTPDVSGTYACNASSCASPIYIDTASTSGIQFNIINASKNNLHWQVRHSVGIPINSLYPNIDYNYVVKATPSSLHAFGSHDGAPSQEMWLRHPAGEIRIHEYMVTKEIDLWKLFPGIGYESWTYDM